MEDTEAAVVAVAVLDCSELGVKVGVALELVDGAGDTLLTTERLGVTVTVDDGEVLTDGVRLVEDREEATRDTMRVADGVTDGFEETRGELEGEEQAEEPAELEVPAGHASGTTTPAGQ